ncbi:MAG: aldehyde ferredoxin oxidoreductase N-terminal domain-containing protein, partial [Desulfatibacillaceae bacterium]|nr:aldehyde ferredoxin oxidoreductase N-terminal domain-containing protein [Desulfatibacillaceae bacterium]
MRGGFAGKTLFVDMSRGVFEERQLSDKLCQRYIGGLGICIRLAGDSIAPGIDPLAPENAVVIGAGPLVGTDAPASSRVYAVTKLAQSKTVGWCGAGGGRFGALLKYAGYDHIVITGQAEKPVYLKITSSSISLEDAALLWGKGAHQTTEILSKNPGGPWGVLAIGQAGENLVPCSMAFVDKASTLGRGGLGAVLGSKNLKAVVASGNIGLCVADKKAYRAILRPLVKSIKEYPYLAQWQELGLLKSLPVVEKEVYLKHKKRRIACVSCPVGDKDIMEFDGTGTICSTSAANLYLPIIYGVKDPQQAAQVI